MIRNAIVVAALVAAALGSAVLPLTPATFDSTVGGSKGVLVKFFAPWCGHCKHLAPEYEKAAEAFAGSAKVALAEVDCDAHGDLCQRFGVQGYPTLKFFPKGDKNGQDYEGGRTSDDIIRFVEENGARRAGGRSKVISLTKANFDSVALNTEKDVLVKFFAPWCGHCKSLAPVYEAVSAAYANEESVVIAEVNCDAEKDVCGRFEVQGFPTLKFFPKGNKQGTPYTGGRDADAFVTFLNENLGLKRTKDGKLNEKAGRVDALDAIAAGFAAAANKAELIEQAETAAKAQVGADAKNAKIYVKIMEKIAKDGAEYVAKEKERVSRFVEGGQVSLKKIDDFTVRLNILNMF